MNTNKVHKLGYFGHIMLAKEDVTHNFTRIDFWTESTRKKQIAPGILEPGSAKHSQNLDRCLQRLNLYDDCQNL